MLHVPAIGEVVNWFGWGNGREAVAAVSGILVVAVLLAPVIVGLLLDGLQRLQISLVSRLSRKLAYGLANFGTLPGVIVHELSHALLAVVTGAKVEEIVLMETHQESLGHVAYVARGPWFLKAIQHTLIACAPTVTGLCLVYVLFRYMLDNPHAPWEYGVLCYLIICLVNHSTMSSADLKLYAKGVWIFVLPLFAVFFFSA